MVVIDRTMTARRRTILCVPTLEIGKSLYVV